MPTRGCSNLSMSTSNWHRPRVKNFLLGIVNKEFLIFLFFLALSFTFWLLITLNESYEKELEIPVYITNVPKNVVITSQSEDTITVTVKDKGFSLLAYMTNKRTPLAFNFDAFVNKAAGKGTISAADITRMAYLQLYTSTRISSVKPDHIEFYFNYGESKRVPVRLAGKIVPGKAYYLAGRKVWPEIVTVYAQQKVLDTLKYVSTTDLDITNFSDTVVRTVELRHVKGIKTVPAKVRIALYPDILTEETKEVPITAINMPPGKVLRTFPSKVTVRFAVGATMFRNVTPDQFSVVADYNELMAHPSEKCTLHLRAYPHTVSRCHLDTRQVDYLIEQQ